MLESILLMLAGLVLLYGGAEGLVRGSAALALRFGIPPLIVGLTIVALGTSSPELVVSIQAALAGRGAIAVGNVVGSNIVNIAVILGIAVLIRATAVHAQLVRFDVPILVGCSVLLMGLLLDGRLGRPEGLLLVAGLLLYVGAAIYIARREPAAEEAVDVPELKTPTGSPWRDVLFMVVGLGALVVGANLLVNGAVTIAQTLGISEAVIGLTIVAIGTSLPEMATSAVAAVRGEGDIAVGNVVGSNLFNILAILGISTLVRPVTQAGVGLVDLAVMTVLAVLLLPLMRSDFKLVRWEGAVLLLVYVGYVVHLLS
ncbi:MAG: calcium/sodium antiporter [Bacteroidetes bacterium]|jgi:cation:H+ antiporter|nr:calcium/sodium antiporter [Bacteroidota bacterium]